MASKHAIRFNNSTRSVTDLTLLADRSAKAAKGYLRDVKRSLEGLGAHEDARVLDALIRAPDLADRIRAQSERLGLIFPTIALDSAERVARPGGVIASSDQARLTPDLQRIADDARQEGYIRLNLVDLRAMALTRGFEDLRTRRTAARLPTPSEAPLTYVTGTLKTDASQGDDQYVLVTAGGTPLRLAASEHEASYMPMPMKWLHGMIQDGPITLQGELGTDGTFQVEGYALNTDGAFDRFTFGRVRVDGEGASQRAFISTSRGDAEVTDPTFRTKMIAMPRLGGIFPGETRVVDGKLVYDHNPREFISLSRFTDQTVMPADQDNARPWASTDMAYSVFRQKPLLLPEGAEARVNHGGRFWARGDVILGADGLGARFDASYVSEVTDQSWGEFSPTPADADPLEVAVLLAEA